MSPKRAPVPKAKAGAGRRRGRVLHRPAAPVLRRPGAREPPERAPEVKSAEEEFREGRAVGLHELPLSCFKTGARIIVTEATYFGGQCQLAGRVREISSLDSGPQLTLQLTGTSNEELLKFGTGTLDRKVFVHLCGATCLGEPHGPGKVHAKKGHLCTPEMEGRLSWEKNLELEEQDDLSRLRALQAEAIAGDPGGDVKKAKKETKASSSSSTGSGRKKKSKKKKKKAKREKVKEDAKGKITPGAESEGEKAKKGKKRKREYGGRSVARKELSVIFGGTGMDPKGRVRRKVTSYAKKKCRRRKDTSSSSSSSSQSGSSTASTEEGGDALQDQGRVRQLHRHGPGLLMSMALIRMKNVLTEVEGVWGTEESALVPVCLRYVRSQLAQKMAGAAMKEAVTLASCVDLLAQGRVAETGDYLVQRLKSLEKISQGISWQTSERLELAPGLTPAISSVAEMQAAKKEARLDTEHRGGGSSWTPKGTPGKGGKKGKSEDKGKGKRKEGGQKTGNASGA